MKIREAMFRVLFPHADIKRASGNEMIDRLFAIREDGCRLAIVKEDGELPEALCGNGDAFIEEAVKQDMLNAGYVQEVKE